MRTLLEDIFVSFREEMMNIHAQKGLSGVKNYLYVNFKIKLKRKEIKKLLDIKYDNRMLLKQQAHKEAWEYAGWNGKKPDVSVIGIKTKLLQAGLFRSGEKMNIL